VRPIERSLARWIDIKYRSIAERGSDAPSAD